MSSLTLADTSIRMYRRKDGRVSLRLRSHLMVNTTVTFRLSAYLRNISCHLTWGSGHEVEFDEVGFTEGVEAPFQLNTMMHGFSASAVTDMKEIRDTVGKLRLDYLISFTGHPSEEPGCFEAVVPMLRRHSAYDR